MEKGVPGGSFFYAFLGDFSDFMGSPLWDVVQ